jgi:hypothetical protein
MSHRFISDPVHGGEKLVRLVPRAGGRVPLVVEPALVTDQRFAPVDVEVPSRSTSAETVVSP